MTTGIQYPKRLIEVDLPIKEISAHARREKSIRHGHISTLHIWWARRPLAACRAVLCASLWPDPADPLCPQSFREEAAKVLCEFAEKVRTDRELAVLCQKHWERWRHTDASTYADLNPAVLLDMRRALLDFIADFANWDAAPVASFHEPARKLTAIAHVALGETANQSPTVADPFAGGGAIPLEAARVGGDVFASDLNPIPVLLNKIMLEYVPRYGEKLSSAVQEYGTRLRAIVAEDIGRFYPPEENGTRPVAYLWARVVRCEGPACGCEIPLIRSLWLARKNKRSVALRLTTRPDRTTVQIDLDEPGRNVGSGTIQKGAAICPRCGYTTPNPRVRAQLGDQAGGAGESKLLAVVVAREGEEGRGYRLPTPQDVKAIEAAKVELAARNARWRDVVSMLPDELIPPDRPSPNARGLSAVTRIGVRTYTDLFTPRQQLALVAVIEALRSMRVQIEKSSRDPEFARAVVACLALLISKMADRGSAQCRWDMSSSGGRVASTFARQALTIVWDFVEPPPLGDASGDIGVALEGLLRVLELGVKSNLRGAHHASQASATLQLLADDSIDAFVTDPPYYDSVPYADLSDFFYVWLRRALATDFPDLFGGASTPKDEEAIWNPSRRNSITKEPKDQAFYVRQMTLALAEGRRVTKPAGIGVVVFAHKSTSGWEAIISALAEAGWIVTASWPVDTEMASRVNAMGTASLASSVHLVCRPRENPDGSLRTDSVGQWRAVLAQLPKRIHEWMPRLAGDGVVGADAIFACLGPALEIFSQYSRVEKASGEVVALAEYLEQVWAAVAHEALSMMFEGADASGLEEDARLTAMWLWTLGGGTPVHAERSDEEEEPAGDDEDESAGPVKLAGFVLEYDAARKIAQGLGAHLDKLTDVVEVKGDKARLLAVSERAKHLFGKEDLATDAPKQKKPKESKKQLGLFAEIEAAEKQGLLGAGGIPKVGETTLDKVHQSMILFGAGRSEALKRFIVEEGVGKDGRFWKLAQSLSALYPAGSEEKRWVDGVLARKKSLGF